MENKYDYLLIGAGLYNCVLAHELAKHGKSVLIFEKNDFIGGTCYTENIDGIEVHKFGPHIFRTNNKEVWKYMEQFTEFNNFINCPVANYNGELYNLPFNMNTFHEIWNDVITPEDAINKIQSDIPDEIKNKTPENLEEQVIKLVGTTIYKKLVKEYTEKQWGKDCKELPPEIIKRLPVRLTYNNNYFNDRYQGIPVNGYTKILENMCKDSVVVLNKEIHNIEELIEESKDIVDKIIYTGCIDQLFGYKFGQLEYRGLKFAHRKENVNNYQGVAVMNYTDKNHPYTRITEHKHFTLGDDLPYTIISEEYSITATGDPSKSYYPINDKKNVELYNKYVEELNRFNKENNIEVILGGRLGNYKYYDMTNTIEAALNFVNKLIKE